VSPQKKKEELENNRRRTILGNNYHIHPRKSEPTPAIADHAMFSDSLVKYGLVFFFPLLYLVYRQYPSVLSRLHSSPPQPTPAEADSKKPLKSIMQAPRDDLAPAKDDPFTTEELKQYDGSDSSKPILVAIKGAPINSKVVPGYPC
jgi:hypothetical protein